MQPLATSLLGQACRIFMELSYPEGPASIPPKRLPYFHLPQDQPLENFLPPAPLATGIAQAITSNSQALPGYAFRLGSAGFAHLKLRAQQVEHAGRTTWVFMVDTHDAFSKDSKVPPADHPDAPQWLALQNANRLLKGKIEAAWEQHGLATFNSLLRQDLQ
jgi:hypothetical protein